METVTQFIANNLHHLQNNVPHMSSIQNESQIFHWKPRIVRRWGLVGTARVRHRYGFEAVELAPSRAFGYDFIRSLNITSIQQ